MGSIFNALGMLRSSARPHSRLNGAGWFNRGLLGV